MKQKNTLIAAAVLLLLSLFARAQNKTDCHTIDFYIQETLKSIQTHDTARYARLANSDIMLASLKEGAAKDTTQTLLYETIKSKPGLVDRLFTTSFARFSKAMQAKLQTDQWDIKLKDYKVTNTEKSTVTEHLTLEVHIDVNGAAYRIMMYVSKYKGCYYIFEPVDPYLSKI